MVLDNRDDAESITYNSCKDSLDDVLALSDMLVSSIEEILFKVELSMSILRGGIADFQNGKLGTDVYKELQVVRSNLDYPFNYDRRRILWRFGHSLGNSNRCYYQNITLSFLELLQRYTRKRLKRDFLF